MNEKEREELIQKILAEGVVVNDLDDIIHNRKSEEATEINNQGVGSQLAYLIEGYEDVSAAELHILDTLDYAKELRSEFG